MDIKIHNTSGINFKNVMLTASCESEYLTFISNGASYGDINAGYYQSYYGYQRVTSIGWASETSNNFNVANYAPLKFKISSDCPIDTTIPINLKMADENGYEWADSFSITVVKSGAELEYSAHTFTDTTGITSSYNNYDGSINPGETIWMDVKIHNKGTSQAKSINIEASCESEYLTFTSKSTLYGDINAGYYQSYYGYQRVTSTGWASETSNNFNVANYAPLKFKISSDCPIDTTIPITLKMTDVNGYEWTDSFNINVVKSGTELEYSDNKITDTTGITSSYNNNDGNINPGETIWMDIKIHNKGTSQAKSVNIEASSNSEYITFTSNSAFYGDINIGYYQSYYGYKCLSSGGWASETSNNFNVANYAPLKFKISSDCPIDTTIPITLKMTDVNGYEWTDSFNINVVKEDINLVYSTHSLSSFDGTIMHTGNSRTVSVTIKNKGISLAKGVTATISSEYPHIQFTTNETSYGDISGGKTKTSSTSFRFEAIADFVVSTVIPMQITITDSKDNVFTETFIINQGI